jgi:hypothetical protein
LRLAGIIVDFLTNQYQGLPVALLDVSFYTTDINIVVGDNNGIDPGLDGCPGDVCVAAVPIGIGGVHVKVNDDFFHNSGP